MDLYDREESKEAPVFQFATVAGVYEDGIALLFDGEETAGEKHYRCNTSVVFTVGDRVKICADSGTYVVEYVVGPPAGGGGGGGGGATIPPGGSAGQALRKASEDDYDVDWQNVREVPTGGSSGDVLTSGVNNSLLWQTPRYVPSGGSAGQVLTFGSGGPQWSNSVELRVFNGRLQFNAGTYQIKAWVTLANQGDLPNDAGGDDEEESE